MVKPVITEMRWLLRVASGLVLIAGAQLFAMSEGADRYFAWTINPPITAAFLGAAYWATFFIALMASRQRVWARARTVLPTVLTFSTLTLALTLLHFDRFHFDSEHASAAIAAWAWLAVYVLVPPTGIFLYIRQLRTRGGDPPAGPPLPLIVRGVLAVHATIMLGIGLPLFVAPLDVAPHVWPWTLSALTGRAVAAWLIATGVAAIHTIRENDIRNSQPGVVTYLALGVLQFVVLARYALSDSPATGEPVMDWGSAGPWVYAALMASVLAVGLWMLPVMLRSRESEPTPAPVSRD